ncbi:MAG TPA: hypothetical protein VIM84_12720 [Gemmatimonadales bacterium]
MPAKHEDIARQRERDWWLLRVEGWTQQRIADHAGVDQTTVGKALRRIEKQLAAEFKEQAEEIKARQTAVLERVADEALQQWQRSCQDSERVSVVQGRHRVVGADENAKVLPLPDQVTVITEGQSGNPALLEKAMAAMAAVRQIWGLDAPVKREDTVNQQIKAYVVSDESGTWPEDV